LTVATDAYRQGRDALRVCRRTLEVKLTEAYEVAHSIRDTLKRSLGRKYSVAWEGTGLRGSLKVPRSVAALEYVLRSFGNYLADHPALEVPTVATAAIAASAMAALTTANTAMTVRKGAVRNLLSARKKAAKTMHLRIRGVVEELKRVIGPVDGRWESFGLNQPGLKQAPPAPENVSVTLVEEDAAMADWDPSPRAEHYRVWVKVIGVDEEARPVGRPADCDFSMEDLPKNAEVEVAISAVNEGGESLRSAVVVLKTGSSET
jgi:hypothetical protein